MAVPSTGNPGVFPLSDAPDAIQQMRYLTGDTESVPYDPPVAGYQNYAAFSDGELQALLDLADGVAPVAVGYAFLKLAGFTAGQAFEWASDDLRVSLAKTPQQLREIAQMWFDRGSAEAGNVDIFEVFQVGRTCACQCHTYEFAWGQCDHGCRCSW